MKKKEEKKKEKQQQNKGRQLKKEMKNVSSEKEVFRQGQSSAILKH